MSSDKRHADNMEPSDDGTKLKKPRLSGSTSQVPKVSTQTTPRRLPAPYIATLPSSSFSATLGLEIFPEPSPPPEPIVDLPLGPGSSGPSASTNPVSSVDASRPPATQSLNNGQTEASSVDSSGPQLSKSLVNNGQTAAEGFEVRIWNELKHKKLQGKIALQNNPSLASKDSRPVVDGQTLQVIHRPQNDTPIGIQRDDLQIAVQKNPELVSTDSRSVVEGQALQVIHRPHNDTPIGIQRDVLQIAVHTNPLLLSTDSRPVVEGQSLQVIHRPQNDMSIGIQRGEQQNVENVRGEMPEAMQHPPGETLPPMGNVLPAIESSLEGEVSQEQQLQQRPRRSSRRIQSQEKKP